MTTATMMVMVAVTTTNIILSIMTVAAGDASFGTIPRLLSGMLFYFLVSGIPLDFHYAQKVYTLSQGSTRQPRP